MLEFKFIELVGAFVVLFAIIDILGAVPIIISLRNQQKVIKAEKAVSISLLIFIAFLFVGEIILNLFGVDIASFAVAGSLVIFVLAIEMIFGVEIFKHETTSSGATIVPIAFPLIAGPGAITTLLSIRAEYHTINIIAALILNLLFVYLVLRTVDRVERIVGQDGIFILRKFFGVILLAIAVKLFAKNVVIMFS
ncbi:MarC family protein [Williamwhitmania taraxaci]|uniref:UPF0056 membrane protein n=1 Tax=Williamwhitmania taraxaci TaxID=1640674 RepID=A0A1G6GIB7_9BACT|nr:MarC family protein [Williamwhitmania taraxaci]SDB81747.1 multiple antibiotic resistance protein [Williamwhitmania taraxaci]